MKAAKAPDKIPMLETTNRNWSANSTFQEAVVSPRTMCKLTPIYNILDHSEKKPGSEEPRGLLLKRSSRAKATKHTPRPAAKSVKDKANHLSQLNTISSKKKLEKLSSQAAIGNEQRIQGSTCPPQIATKDDLWKNPTEGEEPKDQALTAIPIQNLWPVNDEGILGKSKWSTVIGWGQRMDSPVTRVLHRSFTEDGIPTYLKIQIKDLIGDDLLGRFTNPIDSAEFPSPGDSTEKRKERRDKRERPWTHGMKEIPAVETHYEQCLPKDKWLNMRTLKYTSNPRWGQAYQIRRHASRYKPFQPDTEHWLVENDFRIWLLEKSKSTKLELSFGPEGPFVQSEKKVNGRRKVDKIGGHRDLYEQFHSERLRKDEEIYAATILQKHSRGFIVRRQLFNLKRQVALHHGMTWEKFVQDYKALSVRVQKRHGVTAPQVKIVFQEIKKFLDRKIKYEMVFHQVADGERLSREELPRFFRECGLQPRENEIDGAFRAVFKGCGTRAEVVFLFDCSSSSSDPQIRLQKSLVRDVLSTLEVSSSAVRVGMLPFNCKTVQAFGLSAFDCREEVVTALDMIELVPGPCSLTDSISDMRQTMREARAGVPKTCIVVTDSKLKVNLIAEKEAMLARKENIVIFVVGVGNTAENRDLLALASSPEHVFKLTDFYAVKKIKAQVMRKVCLKTCTYCNDGALPDDPYHFQSYDPQLQRITQGEPALNGNGSAANTRSSGRGLRKHEVLELLWTVYPPESACLSQAQRSTWMRPMIDYMQYSKTPEHESDADFDKCLELVLRSQIERNGSITLPVREKSVEEVDNYQDALKHAQDFIKRERLRDDVTRQRHNMLGKREDSFNGSHTTHKAPTEKLQSIDETTTSEIHLGKSEVKKDLDSEHNKAPIEQKKENRAPAHAASNNKNTKGNQSSGARHKKCAKYHS